MYCFDKYLVEMFPLLIVSEPKSQRPVHPHLVEQPSTGQSPGEAAAASHRDGPGWGHSREDEEPKDSPGPEAGPWDLCVGCNPVRRAQDHGRRERAGLCLEPLLHGVDSPIFLSQLGIQFCSLVAWKSGYPQKQTLNP